MNEFWKDIEGYEGRYQVSNLGNVKSLNYNHTGKEKIMKPQLCNKGYLRVELCKDNKRQKYLIHKLVADAFIPNPNNLPCVNHKDENRLNNNYENLEHCTYTYNNTYGNRIKKFLETKIKNKAAKK